MLTKRHRGTISKFLKIKIWPPIKLILKILFYVGAPLTVWDHWEGLVTPQINRLYEPQAIFNVWGKDKPDPVPIPPSKELLLFLLVSNDSRNLEINNLLVKFNPLDVNLTPNNYETQVNIIDTSESHLPKALRYSGLQLIPPGIGRAFGFLYEINKSSDAFCLEFEATATVPDEPNIFSRSYSPPLKKITKKRCFNPIGYPKVMSEAELAREYGFEGNRHIELSGGVRQHWVTFKTPIVKKPLINKELLVLLMFLCMAAATALSVELLLGESGAFRRSKNSTKKKRVKGEKRRAGGPGKVGTRSRERPEPVP